MQEDRSSSCPIPFADPGQGELQRESWSLACGEQMQRDPVTIAGHGAFGALFMLVNHTTSGHLTTAGRLGDRPSTARSARYRGDHSITKRKFDPQQLSIDAGLGPLAQTTIGTVRAIQTIQTLIATADHQHSDRMLEHHQSGTRRRWQTMGEPGKFGALG